MTSPRALLGRGLALPLAPGDAGALPVSDGYDRVEQSIRIILDTSPGERVMRPDFGCGLRRYLMRPNSAATRGLIRTDVDRALRAWEPRIRVREVRVTEGDDPALVLIEVAYLVPPDPSPQSLVYPFYLE